MSDNMADWIIEYVEKIIKAGKDKDKIRELLRDVYDLGWSDGVENGYDNVDEPKFDYNDMD
jgi:hypothetical protein